MLTLSARVVRWIWAICLGVGTCTHAHQLLTQGWTPDGVPIPSAVFWNALTFLDPLAAALLFLRPRTGVAVTLAIMVADVAHNVWAVTAFGAQAWMVALQALFLAFTLATARLLWRQDPARA